MDQATLMTLNRTTDRTLSPISALKQQVTNLEQIFIGCFRLCDQWIVKGKGCASALNFPKILHIGRTSEQNSCYGWWVEWSLETRNQGCSSIVCEELYMHLSVAIFFSFSNSIVCCAVILFSLYFEKLHFLIHFFHQLEWKLKFQQKQLCKVTVPPAANAATYLSTVQKFTLL